MKVCLRLADGVELALLRFLARRLQAAPLRLHERPTRVENAIIQAFAGLVAGGVVTLVVGLVKHGIEHHKSQRH
jgi:hypothetical protein